MAERLIDQDTRFWEVFDENGTSLGLFMYYDLMMQFNAGRFNLSSALENIKLSKHTWKIVGDICPLEEDSDIAIIQKKKIEYRKRENNRDKKRAKKNGHRLESTISFGKHKGQTIKELIHNYSSYWNWLEKNNVLLLHPEVQLYLQFKNK